MKRLFIYLTAMLWALSAQAQYPTVSPQGLFTTVDGEETDDASSGQNAPLSAVFTANPEDVGDYTARYEWKIFEQGREQTPLVHRFEQDINYVFSKSGTFYVQLYATFTRGDEVITYPEEGEENPIVVSISESKLEMPNAFSPNGDGYNDVYKAKEGYQSIVKFKATIFNRWGQEIFSWTNPAEGWDGKWHGRTVKDGVYFVRVNAEGADGRKYRIRRDVNVLTGYQNQEGSTID
ncbi:MAG: gliding motility-associated C-terminal domain-containing protein [Bacteroidaceae bacterium]|nr:gliding motility-associated C-terminal domain-containing protein [Bacteroidaceae bacterium]